MVKNKIRTKTQRNRAVPSEMRLLLALRYLATGSFLRTASDFSGVSPSTASRIVKKVTEAIAALSQNIIKFPDNLELIKRGFYNVAKFPRVIGAIDCTHVNIKSPGGDIAENFRNRKSNFSFNVQVVCDSKLKCMNIVARWPGSAHDQTIFNNCALKQKLESGQFGNGILLGDSGYESKNYLFTPISNPSTPVENLYNESQIRTRNTIERCFGVCKNRFPVLRRQITLNLSRVQSIIVACFVLHNIAIDSNDLNFGENDDNNSNTYEELPAQRLNVNSDATNIMIQEYFLPLLNRSSGL